MSAPLQNRPQIVEGVNCNECADRRHRAFDPDSNSPAHRFRSPRSAQILERVLAEPIGSRHLISRARSRVPPPGNCCCCPADRANFLDATARRPAIAQPAHSLWGPSRLIEESIWDRASVDAGDGTIFVVLQIRASSIGPHGSGLFFPERSHVSFHFAACEPFNIAW
jgi:hypothetical protein